MTYVIVWEFQVAAEQVEAFERAYGPDGDWAALFQRSPQFQGTEVLRSTLDDEAVEDETFVETTADAEKSGRTYFTIDRWASREAYIEFNERWADAYQEMDDRFLELCSSEVCLGKFEVIG